jgi:hypothetical protein
VKKLLKRLLLAVVLFAAGTTAYQVWTFVAFYNQARDILEVTLDRFDELGRAEFVSQLVIAEEAIGIKLDPADVKVEVDKAKRSVRAEFTYTRELHLLVFSVQKQVTVWRTLRNVDFG